MSGSAVSTRIQSVSSISSQVDKLFTDKASGKRHTAAATDALLSFAREGGTVVVHSMDRLARNLDDLRRLVQTLTKNWCQHVFPAEAKNPYPV